MTVDPGYVCARPVYLAEAGGETLGFYGLDEEPPQADLRYLFVAPEAIGQGVGRRLWDHAIETARRAGYARMQVESDPNAEPFYLRMGARRIGEVASSVRPGRMLPLLRFELPGPHLRGNDLERRTLRDFFHGARLNEIPAAPARRLHVLRWLVEQLEPGRGYTESEVNQLLLRHHPDFAALRRYLVDAGLVDRRDGTYRRVIP